MLENYGACMIGDIDKQYKDAEEAATKRRLHEDAEKQGQEKKSRMMLHIQKHKVRMQDATQSTQEVNGKDDAAPSRTGTKHGPGASSRATI